jgi:hypothetical protein
MAVIGYIGQLGSGKTYSMVKDTLEAFRRSPMQVFSNMSGLRCPESIYIEALADLPFVGNGRVMLDECGIFLSSRHWQSVPKTVLEAFALARKNGLDLVWSAHTLERVDGVLRELTSEVVQCRKVGPMIVQHRAGLGEKKNPRRKIFKLEPALYRLYDTLELIGLDGGTKGRGHAATLSTVARRRQADDVQRRERADAAARFPLYRQVLGSNVFFMRKEVQVALNYLREVGGLSDGLPWPDQVRRELERRAWLKTWGLRPDDAPYFCTPSSPWLAGSSPAAVQARRAEQEQDDAVSALVDATKRVRASRPRNGEKAHAL